MSFPRPSVPASEGKPRSRLPVNCAGPWRRASSGPCASGGMQLAAIEKKQAGYVPPGERDDLAALRDFTRSAIDSVGAARRG